MSGTEHYNYTLTYENANGDLYTNMCSDVSRREAVVNTDKKVNKIDKTYKLIDIKLEEDKK